MATFPLAPLSHLWRDPTVCTHPLQFILGNATITYIPLSLSILNALLLAENAQPRKSLISDRRATTLTCLAFTSDNNHGNCRIQNGRLCCQSSFQSVENILLRPHPLNSTNMPEKVPIFVSLSLTKQTIFGIAKTRQRGGGVCGYDSL